MAVKPEYVVRETFINIGRNLTLTVASIATMAVALGLFGAANMFRQGTENGVDRFRDGVEFIVFVDPEATGEQQDAIAQALSSHPDIAEFAFVSQQQAFEEFELMFPDSPELLETVTPDILPPSYRVKPRVADADLVDSLASQFSDRAGVFSVQTAREQTEAIIGFADLAQRWMLYFAIAALIGGALLIFNAIRVAIFARRREIEVMKLVGASNLFIRLPFVLEGLVHGLLGGAVAVMIVRFLRSALEDDVLSSGLEIFRQFFVTDAQFFTTSMWVLVGGAVVGIVSSAIAVGRFLDV